MPGDVLSIEGLGAWLASQQHSTSPTSLLDGANVWLACETFEVFTKQWEFCVIGFAFVFRNVNEIAVVFFVLFRSVIDSDDVLKLVTLGLEFGQALYRNVFACAEVSSERASMA